MSENIFTWTKYKKLFVTKTKILRMNLFIKKKERKKEQIIQIVVVVLMNNEREIRLMELS